MLARARACRDEHGFGLVEAGEIVKITTRAKGVGDIPIAKPDGCRGQNEQTVAESVENALTTPPKKLR